MAGQEPHPPLGMPKPGLSPNGMAIRGGMDAKATASKDGTPTLPSRGALPQPGLWLTLLLRPVASWSGQQLPLPVLGAATIRTTHVFHKVLPARDLNLPKTQMRERSNHSAGKDWASTHRVQLDPGQDPASPQHSPWLCARPAPHKAAPGCVSPRIPAKLPGPTVPGPARVSQASPDLSL